MAPYVAEVFNQAANKSKVLNLQNTADNLKRRNNALDEKLLTLEHKHVWECVKLEQRHKQEIDDITHERDDAEERCVHYKEKSKKKSDEVKRLKEIEENLTTRLNECLSNLEDRNEKVIKYKS